MKTHLPYKLLNSLSVLSLATGLFALVDHVARGVRGGPAPFDTLAVGAVCTSAGILCLVLSDLGLRLYRIEQKLGTLPPDPLVDPLESDSSSRRRRAHQ